MSNGGLSASTSESGRTSNTTTTPQLTSKSGFVAILDALGTKLLSLSEAIEFVHLRDSIMTFTERVVETNLLGINMTRLKKFTFNDTVVLAYEAGPTLHEVERFCHVLRVFETHSIVEGTPFRGAFALGEFYIGDPQTILGPAVIDAATWFESADWIGIQATPHATLFIQALLDKSPTGIDHVLVDYDVPIKDKSKRRLKAVNWPKGFYIPNLRPSGSGKTRSLVLSALAKRRIPKDTESKHFNAVECFDHVEGLQRLDNVFGVTPLKPPAFPRGTAK